MRGVIDDLASPLPLAYELPAVYQEEDPFAVRLAAAFDTELAPIIATLDNLSAYFDPRLAPEDFLGWLASWIALELDETWDVARRRAAMLAAVDIMRRRGTAAGLVDELRLATDGEVEVIENGGSAWSLDPASAMVGSPDLALVVRVRMADPSQADLDRLDRIVRSAKPAHVPHRIEVVGAEPPKKARARADAKASDGKAGSQPTADDQPAAAPGGASGPADLPMRDGDAGSTDSNPATSE
jgi:phage tail-like protein